MFPATWGWERLLWQTPPEMITEPEQSLPQVPTLPFSVTVPWQGAAASAILPTKQMATKYLPLG